MIENILLTHFEAYPQMRPQDAMKLIYQHVFGPEHLITDGGKTLTALEKEMNGLEDGPAREHLYESIGNGLCRLNLRPCKERGIPAEDINRLFAETSRETKGEAKQFWLAVRALQKLAEDGEAPFDTVEMDLFLARYPQKPAPVHHSEGYKKAYRPAYRVISQRKVKDYLAKRRSF